ncbi:MAG: hypothetical protein J2P57_12465 [Acidimicrobiaceae bacterium]|nr:hypothetical protein [Acidimicrobiaceae bacterium]
MTGLLLVLSQPPTGREDEFNRWYDDEHAPARLKVPGITTGRRYRASEDGEDPRGYVALYDLEAPSVLESPEYHAVVAGASATERDMLTSGTFDRRVYESVETPESSRSPDLDVCGDYLLCVWWEPPPDGVEEFHRWYTEEHIPMLMEVPGWLRVRRYHLADGGGLPFVAVHDLASEDVLDHPGHLKARSTPWRHQVAAAQRAYDRRLFRLWRRFDESDTR